jgi:hypothetical protein
MVVQEYKQGNHVIRIESAESLDDASKNGFREGEYNRHYIDNKLTDNYMAMIRFIVDEAKQNKTNLQPTGESIESKREEMFARQKQSMLDQVTKLKQKYGNSIVSKDILKAVDDFMVKTNYIGVRTVK